MCAFKDNVIKYPNVQNIQRNQDMSILYACSIYNFIFINYINYM